MGEEKVMTEKKQETLQPAERLIVALDVEGLQEAQRLVEMLVPCGVNRFKIGLGLFSAAGPSAVEMVHRSGGKVFLDLKFHDIPNTVANACRAAVRMGVWLMNLHIQGGSAMMRQAMEAVREEAVRAKRQPPLVIGVTILTSMAQKDLMDLGLRKPLKDQVLYLAKLAQSAGLDGIVASPQEAKTIRWACGKQFLVVTPGIRPAPAGDVFARALNGDDQVRVATPSDARKAGADFIVVGRPLIEAKDPSETARVIIRELEAAG
ncbi:MAG: orotidine-5'-phosphate decarboxylase [Candidatus Omnitrophica bacterium]|nr:orotidine-5'-phosphate decarboxylase [Candidatus Omnitrophota bacterium]